MSQLYRWSDFRRCALICAVVGCALVFINEGVAGLLNAIAGGPDLPRVALNFAVPFTVASVSSLLANRERLRAPQAAAIGSRIGLHA